MAEPLRVGDFVTHANPDYFGHYYGRILSVKGDMAILEKIDDHKHVFAYMQELKRLDLLDVIAINVGSDDLQ